MKIDRELVRQKFGGNCSYCGCELDKRFHCDHLKPIVRSKSTNKLEKPENDNLENLMPSCPSCNVIKNSNSLEEFRRIIKQFVFSLNNYSTQYKFAKKYGLIQENDIQIKFHFEKYEMQGKEEMGN